MAKYLITEKAGRFVAGHRNTGVGTVLDLLPFAAEYELRLGTLVPVDLPQMQVEAPVATASAPAVLPDPEPEPEPEPEEPVEAPAAAAGKRKRRR
jgi:hypothetical protein